MLKQKNIRKIKFITSFLGISAVGGIAAIVASCAGPSTQTLNNLFSNSNSINKFSDSNNGSAKSLITNALLQNNGYQTLLKTKLSEILGIWYSKNQDSTVRNKYENFVADANDDWKAKVQDFQKQYGNDYQVRLQTDVLDSVGGSKEDWIQDQINQKVLSDFSDQVFAKSFLNYTNDSGAVISAPLPSEVNTQTNWKNIKFIADNSVGGPAINNDQLFAKFQDVIFDKWVKIENPNLVSRIVFANDQPKNGLKEIFDENKIGSSNLSPSYEFQAFKNNLDDTSDKKGTNAYKTISEGDGLAKYYNSANDTIDIPNILSSDSGGKLLMTASDMFNSYDVAFTSAFVYQYLRMLGVNQNDTINNQVAQPTGSDPSKLNIMDNFIQQVTGSTPAASEYTDPNPEYNNIIISTSAPTGFYSSYSNLLLTSPKYKIFNVALPEKPTTITGTKLDEIYKQFILARGKDGVHVIAIDGGAYYLDSTTQQRNLEKQEEFLKYRAYLTTLPNGVPTSPNSASYTFDLNTQLKNWFDAHQVSLIYEVLNQLDQDKSPLLDQNADFKAAFESFQNKFGNYINSFIAYNQVTQIQADIDTMRSKLNGWAQTYSDDIKNSTPEKIGIAAKLPYVREADGDYFGQIQYYLEILNKIDDPTVASTAATDPIKNLIFNDASAKDKTRKALIDEVAKKYETLQKTTNDLVESLHLDISPRMQYSQNIFIKSTDDNSLYLALNLVINSVINSDVITNSIKMDYLNNSEDFKAIQSWEKNSTTPVADLVVKTNSGEVNISGNLLSKAIRNFYYQSAWNNLADKTIYGNFLDQDTLNTKVDMAWENQLGLEQYSTNRFNYNLFLYTLYYLLKDNLANFKSILASQIYQGVEAFVSWTVPANPNTLSASTGNPIVNAFDANPNYLQGAGWNNESVASSSNAVNTWFNTTVSGAVSTTGGVTTNKLEPNVFNDAANPYSYTSPKTGVDLYGFNGITTSSNTGNLNSNVASALFSNYAISGPQGALYSFGSKDKLLSYIDNINNQIILDNLVQKLSQLNIQVINYGQKNAQGRDVYTFAQKKDMVKQTVQSLSDDYFNKFSGFIGDSKGSIDATGTNVDQAYKDSNPVNEDSSKLTVMAALVSQINYQDVQNLGTNNWSDASGTDNKGRLGLDLSSFLSIVVQQAQDPQTQALATSYLIQNNSIEKNQIGQRIIIGDKRLYDALGSQWVTKN